MNNIYKFNRIFSPAVPEKKKGSILIIDVY
jgi:hypothetical protein